MNHSSKRNITTTAVFLIGLAAVAWVGWGFVSGGDVSNGLALTMTAVIAGVYMLGAHELRQYRQATTTLDKALADIPQPLAELDAWLGRIHPGLQNPVRLRIEGERAALPGPALTPYLVGLLVMLGMLGTFLGMVVTFKGAVFALEGSSDLAAIRAALAEPIRGLGLSFGTSVAGVAASAMLGLISAISRRERLQAVRLLDARISTVLRPFSAAHQREETFKALQAQAQAMPLIADRLQAMMDGMERRADQLNQQLRDQQAQFHSEASTAYKELAGSVGVSLKDSLGASARLAGEAIKPVVESAMASITRTFDQGAQVLLTQSEEMVLARVASEAQWMSTQGERMTQLADVWRTELTALREQEAARGQAAVASLDGLHASVAHHLASLGASLEAPMTRLMQTASEVPQAAAGIITQLRQEMTRLSERDNIALSERTELMAQLGNLLRGVNEATLAQRAAIDSLVHSAAIVLEQAGRRFADALGAQAGKVDEVAAHVNASAVELSSLGEAFNHGVGLFSASNDKLMGNLQRIESAISQSLSRSDEQLAYYVAQAREVIDLSISSQQGIVEDLRRLHARPPAALAAAGGA